MRCEKLGVDFANEGEIVVDRCCDYRNSLEEALPKAAVVQDFYHLKERIMLTLSANSPHCNALSGHITDALTSSRSDGNGRPTKYRPTSEEEQKVTKLHEYFSTIEEVGATTFSSTFNLQIAHIAKNCLQRRYHSPLTLLGTRNWHKRLGDYVSSDASA